MSSVVLRKVALITGGAGGIGFAFAKELLRNGAKGVELVDINTDLLQNAKEQIGKEFGSDKVDFTKADVTDRNQLEAAFKKAVQTFNQLDIVINNAGISDDANYEKEIQINCGAVVGGSVLAINEYLPKYKSGNEAYIINTSSVAGLYPFPGLPVYSGTKCFVTGFTQAIGAQVHYERTKIKVLAICPGLTTTRLVNSWKSFNNDISEVCKRQLKGVEQQTPSHVGKELITVLKKGKSGSIWVIEENKPASEIEKRTFNEFYNNKF